MDGFTYKRGQLYCEDIPVASLAQRHGTPAYVYSRAAILNSLNDLQSAFQRTAPLLCYSVKANSNLSILRALARAGAGFDVVSGGELFRVLKAGARPSKVVFAGVGKLREEIRTAIEAGIHMFNVESTAELHAINAVASSMGAIAPVALRLNPDVDARTNAKTTTAKKETKFGIDLHRARTIFADKNQYPSVRISGLHVHLGSPIHSVAPFSRALKVLSRFLSSTRDLGAEVTTLNIGGGYCISYDGKKVIAPKDYARVIEPVIRKLSLRLIIEPGRYIVGNAGILLATATYVKEGWLNRRFIILDAAMNDLLRPALYGAEHHIWPVIAPPSPMMRLASAAGKTRKLRLAKVDIVGPICETSDCFGKDRRLPPVRGGELVAIYSAGAYGMTMSSNYNSRPRPCEILVSGKRHRLVRRRETYEDMMRGE